MKAVRQTDKYNKGILRLIDFKNWKLSSDLFSYTRADVRRDRQTDRQINDEMNDWMCKDMLEYLQADVRRDRQTDRQTDKWWDEGLDVQRHVGVLTHRSKFFTINHDA